MKINRTPQRAMRTATPAMSLRTSAIGAHQRVENAKPKPHPPADDEVTPINDDSLFSKKGHAEEENEDGATAGGGGNLFSKKSKDSAHQASRSSLGSADSAFKPMKGDLNGYDANAKESDGKPAKNDTGVPHTPSGASV